MHLRLLVLLSYVPRGKAHDKHKKKTSLPNKEEVEEKTNMDARQGMCRGCARLRARAPLFSSSLFLSSPKAPENTTQEETVTRQKSPPLLCTERQKKKIYATTKTTWVHPLFSLFYFIFSISGSFINHWNRRESAGRTRKIK
jgi:hypothetical protein